MNRNNNNDNSALLLNNGAQVEIHGLHNATHLTGKRGRLQTFHREGAHARRWAVRVSAGRGGGGGGESHAIKPENLKLVVVEQQPPPQPHQARPSRTRRDIRNKNNRTHRNNNRTGPAIQAVSMGRDASGLNSKNDAWAIGLSVEDQYEWLSNCYQMRCDDDYVYTGDCNLHGPYNPEATPESITSDFMAFCLLAKRSNCIPAAAGSGGGWRWQEFLRKAAGFVGFAFEKSDAKVRWGSENFFNAMMGGRSLRYTAERVVRNQVTVHKPSVPCKKQNTPLMQFTMKLEAAMRGQCFNKNWHVPDASRREDYYFFS